MTESVVHGLELIEVEKHDRQTLIAATCPRQRNGQPILEQNPIRQAGQRIVVGAVLDLSLSALTIADVQKNSFQQTGSPGTMRKRHVLERPDHLAILCAQTNFVVGHGAALEKSV